MSEPQDEPPSPEPAHPRSPQPPPRLSLLDKAAYIAAPGTVVIGLLYYFGSAYTDAYYSTFGVPPGDLQLSVQAYLVKSPEAVFGPVWFLLVCGLVALLGLGRLGHALARPGKEGRRRRVCRCLLVGGLLMVLLGFPFFYWERMPNPLPESWWGTQLVPPLVVALGATLAFFAVQQRLHQAGEDPDRPTRTADQMWLVGGALLIGLLTMSLFYDASRYVTMAGRSEAWKDIEGGYQESLPVVVYSRVPLTHDAPKIQFKDKGPGSGPFRYQYLGFRLLAKAPSRYYLVSYASRHEDHLTVVLPDDDTLRVELTSAPALR
ncbi:hypothetical protein ACFWUQ_22580 [Streptomyces sp. NPDC058662]|uniref:hypothetical protein n=1 Tax=Streptomyces sp. NPDC058662 TaxID=3346583 RepID=UPI0036521B60